MRDLGIVKPGSTIYLPFATYDSNDPAASVTISGLAVGDIKIYKDGSMTERASTSGFTLLDTDGIDLDGLTGIHGVSIDLSDNTTASFYEAGARYFVVLDAITADGGTIRTVLGNFQIGYPDAAINTTIATLSTQTSFTLTSGPAEDDALNGCVVCIHDIASAIQLGFGVISDYTGSTKTVTLTAGVSFTAAAGDNISIYPPANSKWFGQTAQAGDGTNLTEAGGDGDHLTEAGGTGDQFTGLPSVTVGTNNDKTGYSITGTPDVNVAQISGDATAADNLESDYDGTGYNKSNSTIGTCTANTDMRGTDNAFLAANAPTNFSDLSITATTGRVDVASIEGTDATDQINAACDTAIETYNLHYLVNTALPTNWSTDITANSALDYLADDGTATYDRTTDSLQAIRDRGDSSWTTGGGGGISDILNIQPLLPNDIDLGNTKTWRLGLMLINSLDDLPTTGEITPGTIDIDRAAIGDTSWTSVVSGAACSELAGMIYYDEVFDSGTGYAEGDSIRITFKSQKITVSANDYEISDANGRTFYTSVRQTMRGTDSAYTGTPPTAASIRSEIDSNSTQLAAIVADTNELQGDWADGGRLDTILDARASQSSVDTVDSNVDAILLDTAEIGTAGAGLTNIPWNASWDAEVQSECTDALNAYDPPTNAEMEARTPTAAQLAYIVAHAQTAKPVTFSSGTTTTAVLATVDGNSPSSTDDFYNGRILIFNAGTLDMQVTDITDYTGSSNTATITAVTTAVTSSHTAILV